MKNLFRIEKKRKVKLTEKEEEKILEIDPLFQLVLKSIYFDNYDLPCPILVEVKTKYGELKKMVLRKTRHGNVKKEVQIIKLLEEFGLPVPKILHLPFKNENGAYVAIYSLLPGENLQKLSMGSKKELNEAKRLLISAVTKLMDATQFIRKSKISRVLPIITLDFELKKLNSKDNSWLKYEIFQSAIKKLKIAIKNINTPLVFSNGDYQPGNFLVKNGKITGFLDFESPSFQDPLMGFVKYPIYDLIPLSRTNIIKLFSKSRGFSKKDFNLRLAIGCLKTLKKEIPVNGGNKEVQKYRKRVLNLLDKSLKGI